MRSRKRPTGTNCGTAATSMSSTRASRSSTGDTVGRRTCSCASKVARACACRRLAPLVASSQASPSRRHVTSASTRSTRIGWRNMRGQSSAAELDCSLSPPPWSVPSTCAVSPATPGRRPCAFTPKPRTSAVSWNVGCSPARSRVATACSASMRPVGARPAQRSNAGGARTSASGQRRCNSTPSASRTRPNRVAGRPHHRPSMRAGSGIAAAPAGSTRRSWARNTQARPSRRKRSAPASTSNRTSTGNVSAGRSKAVFVTVGWRMKLPAASSSRTSDTATASTVGTSRAGTPKAASRSSRSSRTLATRPWRMPSTARTGPRPSSGRANSRGTRSASPARRRSCTSSSMRASRRSRSSSDPFSRTSNSTADPSASGRRALPSMRT